jgi:hypothetical protein
MNTMASSCSLGVTRRRALASAGGLLLGAPAIWSRPSSDIRITETERSFEDFRYRTPIKFGGSVVDRVTILNVGCTVRGRQGETAHGFGSMTLGNVFLCVQDLTCPGASLAHSVTLAAHVPTVKAVEANARQYVPAANSGWEKRFPGIFVVKDGMVRTAGLNGLGLGVVAE